MAKPKTVSEVEQLLSPLLKGGAATVAADAV